MVEDRTRELANAVAKLKIEVHERRRAEDTVRRNSALLRGVFNGIQDGIIVADAERNIVMANRAVEEFFPGEGTIGFKTRKCFEVFRQAAEGCDNCAADRAIEEGTTQAEILSHETAKDGMRWFERFTFPLYDDQRAVKGTIHYLRDITEKRTLEERARRQDHLAALGQISAGIAHEINNPNNIIMGNSELLQDVWRDADSLLLKYQALHGEYALGGLPFSDMRSKVPQMINRIVNSSIRIGNIVAGMKNYTASARLDHVEKVNVNDAANFCIDMLSEQIRDKTDKFQLRLDEELPLVAGSKQALEEVIYNLIVNALQALPDRTKGVFVFTRRDPTDGSVILEVRDEGVGMSSEVLRQSTSPFFTTKQDSGGMGLGLSIVHSMIKNHHGSLDFESRSGEGTVAIVRLPAEGQFKITN
jgi:PAS domain S-box-containing protein